LSIAILPREVITVRSLGVWKIVCRYENTQGGNKNGECIVVEKCTLLAFFVYIGKIPIVLELIFYMLKEK
jgi:hypothetical protein